MQRTLKASLEIMLFLRIILVWSQSLVESGLLIEVWQKMQLMQLSSKLNPSNECITSNLRLIGGDGLEPSFFTILAQQSVRMKKSYGGKVVPGVMDTAAAKHLSHAYGTFAERVATIAQNETPGKRLAHGYPYLEA